MSTEPKKRGRGRWIVPLLLAMPFLAAVVFAAVRFGPDVVRLINVMIKAAVMS